MTKEQAMVDLNRDQFLYLPTKRGGELDFEQGPDGIQIELVSSSSEPLTIKQVRALLFLMEAAEKETPCASE